MTGAQWEATIDMQARHRSITSNITSGAFIKEKKNDNMRARHWDRSSAQSCFSSIRNRRHGFLRSHFLVRKKHLPSSTSALRARCLSLTLSASHTQREIISCGPKLLVCKHSFHLSPKHALDTVALIRILVMYITSVDAVFMSWGCTVNWPLLAEKAKEREPTGSQLQRALLFSPLDDRI